MYKKLLFGLVSAAALAVSVPASAVEFDVGPGGVAVHRDHDWWLRHHRRFRDEADCRVVRERIVRPNGRVIIRTRRDCD